MTAISVRRFYSSIFDKKKLKDTQLCHSSVYYVLEALRSSVEGAEIPQEVQDCAKALTVDELKDILHEEGLLPASDYGIPRWYARKWKL